MSVIGLFAVAGFAGAASLETEVRTAYNSFRNSVERYDVSAVSKFLDPGFTLNLPSGQILSRSRYLDAVVARKSMSVGVGAHTFKLTSVREKGGYVRAKVNLTLDSKFSDGNLMTHKLKTVEQKDLTWKRTSAGLKLVTIFANEVTTIVDGKQVSRVVRK